MKLKTILAGMALATVLGVSAPARADFYDGCRGPNTLQLDQRVGLGKESTNYTLLPKVFVDVGEEEKGGIFGVAPLMYTPEHKPVAGAGIGGYYSLENVSLLGVVPVVYNAEGRTTNINPTLYATLMAGRFLVDPRISYLASIADGKTSHTLSFGSTVGFKLDNIILGFDVETSLDPKDGSVQQLKDNFKYQGILRIDLDQKHKNWLQTYISKDAVGIGFRANFDCE
ncbi:MAG: hypothetical protein WCV90_02945 [Candidatus Woesearchaeota archaeon]|jgi:hypothetical protein